MEENINDILEQQQQELERIRRKRNHNGGDYAKLRTWLNALFMLLALIGIGLYFYYPEQHIIGWSVIGAGMVLKVVEFFIRFMF